MIKYARSHSSRIHFKYPLLLRSPPLLLSGHALTVLIASRLLKLFISDFLLRAYFPEDALILLSNEPKY